MRYGQNNTDNGIDRMNDRVYELESQRSKMKIGTAKWADMNRRIDGLKIMICDAMYQDHKLNGTPN